MEEVFEDSEVWSDACDSERLIILNFHGLFVLCGWNNIVRFIGCAGTSSIFWPKWHKLGNIVIYHTEILV